MKAGWYRDRDDESIARYWDGTAWTEKTQPIPAQAAPKQPPVASDALDIGAPVATPAKEADLVRASAKMSAPERTVRTGRMSGKAAIMPTVGAFLIAWLIFGWIGMLGTGGAVTSVVLMALTTGITLGIMLLRKKFATFVLTNVKISAKSGVLNRKNEQIFLKKVEAVSVEQPLFGRMLGYGTVVITGTGGTRSEFKGMSDPQGFRDATQEQIDSLPA